MSKRMKWSVLPAALLMMGSLAMAQNTSTKPDPTVGQRAENGQDRTASGAQSGPLSASESSDVDSEEGAIYGAAGAVRSANGGKPMSVAVIGVNKAFDDLSRAFANRDLGAVKQLWPSIPERPSAALETSFAHFKSVSRNFKAANIDVNGDTATVVGSYSGSFVRGTTNIPSSGTFHATLRRTGMGWTVATLLCN